MLPMNFSYLQIFCDRFGAFFSDDCEWCSTSFGVAKAPIVEVTYCLASRDVVRSIFFALRKFVSISCSFYESDLWRNAVDVFVCESGVQVGSGS